MSGPVLITGISGALGKKVALLLRGEGHQIIGVDSRPWPDKPKDIEVLAVDLRKRAGEDLFRQKRPSTVIHLATVSYLQADKDERYRTNLGGTRSVFDHCAHWGVDETIFASRHTYYGAASDAPLYHTEDDPPLAVVRRNRRWLADGVRVQVRGILIDQAKERSLQQVEIQVAAVSSSHHLSSAIVFKRSSRRSSASSSESSATAAARAAPESASRVSVSGASASARRSTSRPKYAAMSSIVG